MSTVSNFRVSFCSAVQIALVLPWAAMPLWGTSVQLTSSVNPAQVGTAVMLQAAITPSAATGNVTFYDGPIVLGVAAVTAGNAQFSTPLLPTGNRKLFARYDGDTSNAPAVSAVLTQRIVSLAGLGFPGLLSLDAGAQPGAVAAGDFNGDGNPDVAVLNLGDDTVSVFLGGGSGLSATPIDSDTDFSPQSLAVGDFNGDGIPDLAISTLDGIDILIGAGDGTFSMIGSYPAGSNPLGLVVCDLNGDGVTDLVVADNESATTGGNGEVVVLLGNGDGSFSSTPYPAGNGTITVAVGDFNGDGKTDVAAVNDGDNTLSIFIGSGTGVLTAGQVITVGNSPTDARADDLNGDGLPDLAVVNGADGTVLVLLGQGNGSFGSPVTVNVGNLPAAIGIADFNGDGVPDLGVVNSGDQTLSVLFGSGGGSFTPSGVYSAGSSAIALALADFNHDGVIDVALADEGDFGADQGHLGLLLGGGCSFSVIPSSFIVDKMGSAFNAINVSASSPFCTWNATTSAAWLTLSTASGLGSGQDVLNIAPNNTGVERTGTLTVGGHSIPITERGTMATYADVPASAYYFDGVNELASKHITTGCGNDDFCPDALIPREQMAVFIIRAVFNGSDAFTYSQTPHFTDVPASNPYFPWIQKLSELGITTGCGNAIFCPSSIVTRDEAAVFTIRLRYGATEAAALNPPATPFFTDVPASYWAFQYIQQLKLDGITNGCSADEFCPFNPVTRGQAAIFIMRGGFNQLLPATQPFISSVVPNTIAHGQTAQLTVTGVNTNFAAGATTLAPISGVTINSLNVVNATTLSVSLTAASNASAQPISLFAITGSEEAVLPNGLVIQ